MTNNKNNHYILITTALCLLLSLYSITRISQMDSQISSLKRNVDLTRALSFGKSKQDVIVWMGKPDKIIKKLKGEVMMYKSSPSRIQGNQDIIVIVNEENEVVNVYYPDNPKDRVIIESKDVMVEREK